MARIKYGSLISQASGSIGSATFQKSLYGDTLRNKPRPRRSSTPPQLVCRSIMMSLHAAWSSLNAQEREQWNQFIIFANAVIRRDRNVLQSGHSYFLKYNYLRLLTGSEWQRTPLYTPLIVDAPQINLVWAGDDNLWDLYATSSNIGNGFWMVVKLSYKIPGNHSFRRSGLRYMPIPLGDGGIYPMMDIYYSIFGYYLQQYDFVNYEVQYFGLDNTLMSQRYTGTLELI